MHFVAIDVETANPDMSSICQIGVARYENGQLAGEWRTLVDPEDYFDDFNVAIHGIDESSVNGAPTFAHIAEELWANLQGNVVVSHTHFDRVALHQASQRHSLSLPSVTWLDSARVARRTWEDIAWKGYGLYSICEKLGYLFKHHDALEDAKAAARVLLAAIEKTGVDVDGWLKRVRQPIDPDAAGSGAAIRRAGNPEGPLAGEVIVFTGALEIPRREAADMAASLGCDVSAGVSKKTTMLVVGNQDLSKLAGHERSSKHRKAEELIKAGVSIRILKECDFKEFARLYDGIA
jgi:DNA polymerase III subunit epsilon